MKPLPRGTLGLEILLLAGLSVLSFSKATSFVRNSEELWAALQDDEKATIQIEGHLQLDPERWKTTLLGRNTIIYGEDREKTVLDFNGVSEALVVDDSSTLELRDMHIRGFPSMPTLAVGNFSRFRSYTQYSWPSLVTFPNTTVFHNRTWVESAYLYTPAFYAQQAALFGLPHIYEQVDSRTFIFHGLHSLPATLVDQWLEEDVGTITITINEVKVTSALTAPEVSSGGSATISSCSSRTLIIGWQTVLIALALAVGILLFGAFIGLLFRRPLLARLRAYDRHGDVSQQAYPEKPYPNFSYP